MLIGKERAGADRVAEQGKTEDLTKLKGPWKWAWLVSGVAGVLAVGAAISGIYFLSGRNPAFLLFFCVFFFCVAVRAVLARNAIIEYKLWWYTEDGKLKVTTKDPMCATGLVIEVWIKTRPSVTLYWGVKRWKYMDETHVSSKDGEVMLATGPAANLEGVTLEVRGLLSGVAGWKIIPQDHGRILRFVDRNGMTGDVQYLEVAQDLCEILLRGSWFNYRLKQRQQLVDIYAKKVLAEQNVNETRERLQIFLNDVVSRRKLPRITAESLRLEHALLRLIYLLFHYGFPSQAVQARAVYEGQFDLVDKRLKHFISGEFAVENPFKLKKDPAPVADDGSVLQGAVRAS